MGCWNRRHLVKEKFILGLDRFFKTWRGKKCKINIFLDRLKGIGLGGVIFKTLIILLLYVFLSHFRKYRKFVGQGGGYKSSSPYEDSKISLAFANTFNWYFLFYIEHFSHLDKIFNIFFCGLWTVFCVLWTPIRRHYR